MRVRSFILSGFLLLAGTSLWAQSEAFPDSLLFVDTLRQIVVSSTVFHRMIEGNAEKGFSLGPNTLTSFPAIMGDANPMVAVKSLPWVQTAVDDQAGLYVMGCEHYSNEFTLCGAPIYVAPRIGDFFPLFNMSHFQDARFSTASERNFVGGSLQLEGDEKIVNEPTVEANVGLLNASASVGVPLSEKFMLRGSGRHSYLHLVYPDALKMDNGDIGLRFGDYNLSALWKPNDQNDIDLHFMYDWNKMDLGYGDYNMNVLGRWKDMLASARWKHRSGRVTSSYTLYNSRHSIDVDMPAKTLNLSLCSFVNDLGLHTTHLFPRGFNVGADYSYYHIQPQRLHVNQDYFQKKPIQPTQDAMLLNLRVGREFPLGTTASLAEEEPLTSHLSTQNSQLTITPTLSLTGYTELHTGHEYLHPDVDVEFKKHTPFSGTYSLHVGTKHQYVSQTGPLSSAFPMKFQLGAGEFFSPERSHYATFTHSIDLWRGKYALTTGVYYKRICHALEYDGFIFDLMSFHYNLKDCLIYTEGHNFGANIMLSKNTGPLTGWISYAFGRALRRTDAPGYPNWFPASHERLHEVNVAVTYKHGRWTLGGTSVLASGLPYTPVSALYLVSESVLAQYGEFNSCRMKPYFRLDIMARYDFYSGERCRHGIGVSLYNASCIPNEMAHYVELNNDRKTFRYRSTGLIGTVVPSLNYFVKI